MKIARVAVPLVLAAFACDHPTPPEPGTYTPGGPFNTVPSGKLPLASIAASPSRSRHWPTASKFSSAKPNGSICL